MSWPNLLACLTQLVRTDQWSAAGPRAVPLHLVQGGLRSRSRSISPRILTPDRGGYRRTGTSRRGQGQAALPASEASRIISAETLSDALGLGRVPPEELVSVLAGVFPLSRWESGDRITYFHPERGHALDVVYNKHGQIMRYEPGPGLTDELVATLRERAEVAFAPDTGLRFGATCCSAFRR